MATTKIRNVSGRDLQVPLPRGGYAVVPANHQHEFEAEHARSLLAQQDVWAKVESPAKKDKDE